jgi:hypothetical protein
MVKGRRHMNAIAERLLTHSASVLRDLDKAVLNRTGVRVHPHSYKETQGASHV